MRDDDLEISKGRIIPGHALEVRTARASGPGGQNVNKTESKVQVYLDVSAITWLSAPARIRLLAMAGKSIDTDGRPYVVSQENRDQLRNVAEARQKLVALVERALIVPKKRVATKPTRGSKERRLGEKKRRSETKVSRGRVNSD